MKEMLRSQTAKIALGIIIGFGVVILIVLAISGLEKGPELSQEKVKEIALKEAGVNESELYSISIEKEKVDSKEVYRVSFKTASNTYSYDIDKNDGEVLRGSYQKDGDDTAKEDAASETTNDTSVNTKPDTSKEEVNTVIDEAKAKTIALNDAGVKEEDVSYIYVKKDRDDGINVYEVEFYVGSKEYDYESAQDDSRIISKDYDAEHYNANSCKAITLEEAKAKALARVEGAGGSDIRIHEDYDDGYRVYEGEIYYNGMEYEFTILADSGEIVEWSAETWR